MKEKQPKILVATPIFSQKHYMFPTWYNIVTNLTYKNYTWLVVDNSKGLSYTSKLRREGYHNIVHVNRGESSRSGIANASEYIREYAIKNDYDYIMMIESDLLPPLDVIERLLARDKKIIGFPYEVGIQGSTDSPRRMCVQVPHSEPGMDTKLLKLIGIQDGYNMLNKGVQRVGGMGLGCTLIHKEIFKEYFFKYSKFYAMHTDSIFYIDLANNNVPVYLDTDLVIEHRNQNWIHVKDR